MSDEKKKTVHELADALMAWTKSGGKKPKRWAKIPVAAVNEMSSELKAASDADWKEAGEKIREWENHCNRQSDLLKRSLPFLVTAEAILRRACKGYEKGEANMDRLAVALQGTNDLSQLMGEIRKAVAE